MKIKDLRQYATKRIKKDGKRELRFVIILDLNETEYKRLKGNMRKRRSSDTWNGLKENK